MPAADIKTDKITIPVSKSAGTISALIAEPKNIRAMMLLAHGAGAGMTHHFMESLTASLAELSIGTLRFNFPYMENGKKRPDPPAIAEKAVEACLNKIHELYPHHVIVAAGKSFGGRMASQYLSKECARFVKGIIFYGFPLHAAGNPSTVRAVHLQNIHLPMLFLQGTRDALADIHLMEQVCTQLSHATLKKLEGADHSFKAGKRELIPEIAEMTSQWINSNL